MEIHMTEAHRPYCGEPINTTVVPWACFTKINKQIQFSEMTFSEF